MQPDYQYQPQSQPEPRSQAEHPADHHCQIEQGRRRKPRKVRPAASYSGYRQFGAAFWGVLIASVFLFLFVFGVVAPMGGY